MHLLVAAGYIGKFGETDGVVTTWHNLLQRLSRSDIQTTLIAYGPEDSVEKIGSATIITHRPRLAVKIDPIRWIDAGFFYTRTAHYINSQKFDLVQTSTPDPMGLAAVNHARRNGIPSIAVYHTALDHYARIRISKSLGTAIGNTAGRITHNWLNYYFNKTDLVLAPSEAVKKNISEKIRVPIEILGRGIDCNKFNPSKRSRISGKICALYVGRIAPEKNLQLLVKLLKDRPDIEFMAVGDGPYLTEMKRSLPQGIFPGRLSGDELVRAYADADMFLFPSHTDTFGNVVLEAMASGLPAVVTGSLGPKEIVSDGIDGFVARSDEEFGQALDRLAEDSGLRTSMRKAARIAAEKKTWDNIYEKLCGCYKRLCPAFKDTFNAAA
ncbi:MAG: glycosyltransferase [candidate division Zixibacteria bacterium]|nr:glycosyltransferase [candidate division Zixibacteria bacterium]